MTVKVIRVFDNSMPTSDDVFAVCLFIFNSTSGTREDIETSSRYVKRIGVTSFKDVHDFLSDWLPLVDFLIDDYTLNVYSESDCVSSEDAAFIAHTIVPEAKVVRETGIVLRGFSVSIRNPQFPALLRQMDESHA